MHPHYVKFSQNIISNYKIVNNGTLFLDGTEGRYPFKYASFKVKNFLSGLSSLVSLPHISHLCLYHSLSSFVHVWL